MGENEIPSGKAEISNGVNQTETDLQLQQDILNELSRLAIRSTYSSIFIQDLVDLLTPVIQVDFFAIFEKLPEGDGFLLKAGWGWEPDLIGNAELEGKPGQQASFTYYNDASLGFDKKLSIPSLLQDHQISNGMTVVIPGKERPFGILGIYTKNEQRDFSNQELSFFRNIANILGLVFDRHLVESSLFAVHDERRLIFESITDGIMIQENKGKLLFANQVAADLLGYPTPLDMLAVPLTEVMRKYKLYDEAGKPFPTERLPGSRALKGEKSVVELVRFSEFKTGSDRWFIIKASPVLNEFEQVKYAVNIFQDVSEMKRIEADQAFLSELSTTLASSLDNKKILNQLADIAVKYVADWCVIHTVSADDTIERVVTTHKDPTKRSLALELQKKYSQRPSFKRGAYQVIKTGEPEFFPQVSDSGLQAIAENEEHFNMLRTLGFRSAMVLPMIARGHSLGAISFMWGGPTGYYGIGLLARELTWRAALVVDNVRLYHEAQSLNLALEAKVKRRTDMLERAVEKLNNEIKERKIIEKDLIRSRASFSDLFDLSPDAVFLVNEAGEIKRANLEGQTKFGYDLNELIGGSIEMLLPERSRKIHLSHRGNFYADPQRRVMAANLELFGRKKSGDEFPVDVMLSPVKIGDEWFVISSVRDMTKQKRIQAELSEVQHRLIDSQEAERLTLAQELHDGMIQELFSINFQLSEIEKDLEQAGLEEIRQKIQASSKMTQQVVQGLRSISRNLRPPALTPFGLEQAIYSHMEYFREIHPELSVHLELTPDGNMLEDRLRLGLFRIYQNGVSNTARHAEAKNLWVSLNFDEDELSLEMKDDGKGFEMPIRWIQFAREGHLGLVGTRERVEAVGGKLFIESAPGKGTLIRVVVPLP